MDTTLRSLIVGRSDVGDGDRTYDLLTCEEGLVRVRARGVRKTSAKLAAHLETLTLSSVSIARGKGRGVIVGAVSEEKFPFLKTDAGASVDVLSIVGAVSRRIPLGEKNEALFDLVLDYLRTADKMCSLGRGEKVFQIGTAALSKFLTGAGYAIVLGSCAICGGEFSLEKNFPNFSPEHGGVVHRSCCAESSKIFSITKSSWKFLRLARSVPISSAASVIIDSRDASLARNAALAQLRWAMD